MPPHKSETPLASGVTQEFNNATAANDYASAAHAQVTPQMVEEWTRRARWLAGEFHRTGNWRAFKAQLLTVIGIRQQMLKARERQRIITDDEIKSGFAKANAACVKLRDRGVLLSGVFGMAMSDEELSAQLAARRAQRAAAKTPPAPPQTLQSANSAEPAAAATRKPVTKQPQPQVQPLTPWTGEKPQRKRERAPDVQQALPHSVEAEMGVLSSILTDAQWGGSQSYSVLAEVAAQITPDYFYVPAHKTIYECFLQLWHKGIAIELIGFTEWMRDHKLLDVVGGAAYVTSLINYVPTAANVGHYVSILIEKLAQREAITEANRLVRQLWQPSLTNEGGVNALLSDFRLRSEAICSLAQNSDKPLIEFLEPTQLRDWKPPDGILIVGDYHIVKGNVFVIGGAPSVGKSLATVALAKSGADQTDWLGLPVHRTFKILIVQNENGRYRLQRQFVKLDCERLDKFMRISPPPPYGFCFSRRQFREQLAREIAEFQPDIVIFDPWNAAAREQTQENYLDALDALKSVLPSGDDAPALGIVAHTRKPRHDERASGRALLNLLAGSYVLGTVPRTVWVMQAASDDVTDDRVVWTCCKNNDGEFGPGRRSAWERVNGLFVPVPDFDWELFEHPDKDRREKITTEALRKVLARPRTRDEAAKELGELTDADKSTCYRALKFDGRFAKHLHFEHGKISWK